MGVLESAPEMDSSSEERFGSGVGAAGAAAAAECESEGEGEVISPACEVWGLLAGLGCDRLLGEDELQLRRGDKS